MPQVPARPGFISVTFVKRKNKKSDVFSKIMTLPVSFSSSAQPATVRSSLAELRSSENKNARMPPNPKFFCKSFFKEAGDRYEIAAADDNDSDSDVEEGGLDALHSVNLTSLVEEALAVSSGKV